MSVGEVAAIVAAGGFVLLVLLLAIPLLKLGKTLDEATLAIRKTQEGTTPILAEAHTTVAALNTQLENVEGVSKGLSSITTNAAALTSVVASTVGSPLIKVAAFSYGVRRSIAARQGKSSSDASASRHGRAGRRRREG